MPEPNKQESDSILNSVKELLGIESECKDFDKPILLHINSAITVIRQYGIGEERLFRVTSAKDTYRDYLGRFYDIAPLVNEYIYFYVKKNFDTPQTSPLISAVDNELKQAEWRLILFADERKAKRERW